MQTLTQQRGKEEEEEKDYSVRLQGIADEG